MKYQLYASTILSIKKNHISWLTVDSYHLMVSKAFFWSSTHPDCEVSFLEISHNGKGGILPFLRNIVQLSDDIGSIPEISSDFLYSLEQVTWFLSIISDKSFKEIWVPFSQTYFNSIKMHAVRIPSFLFGAYIINPYLLPIKCAVFPWCCTFATPPDPSSAFPK